MKAKPLMSTEDVAKAAGCTVGNVVYHIAQGNLPATKVGRTLVIKREDYLAWHAKRIEAARERLRRLEGE